MVTYYRTMREAIVAHLELYRSQKGLEPAERGLSLVGIADMLEDTINKMTKRKESTPSVAKPFKFTFIGYAISPPLDREDKEAISEMALDVDGLAGKMSELIEVGYSIKCSFDVERKAYQAYLSACEGPNSGLVLGMYGRDMLKSLAAVIFAHEKLLNGVWQKKGTVRDSDIA